MFSKRRKVPYSLWCRNNFQFVVATQGMEPPPAFNLDMPPPPMPPPPATQPQYGYQQHKQHLSQQHQQHLQPHQQHMQPHQQHMQPHQQLLQQRVPLRIINSSELHGAQSLLKPLSQSTNSKYMRSASQPNEKVRTQLTLVSFPNVVKPSGPYLQSCKIQCFKPNCIGLFSVFWASYDWGGGGGGGLGDPPSPPPPPSQPRRGLSSRNLVHISEIAQRERPLSALFFSKTVFS